jgi:hypothetical protein
VTAYAEVLESEIMKPLRTAVAFTDVMLAAAKLRAGAKAATKAQRHAADALRGEYEQLRASEQHGERAVVTRPNAAIGAESSSFAANAVLLERAIRLLRQMSDSTLDTAGAELLLQTLVELERQR